MHQWSNRIIMSPHLFARWKPVKQECETSPPIRWWGIREKQPKHLWHKLGFAQDAFWQKVEHIHPNGWFYGDLPWCNTLKKNTFNILKQIQENCQLFFGEVITRPQVPDSSGLVAPVALAEYLPTKNVELRCFHVLLTDLKTSSCQWSWKIPRGIQSYSYSAISDHSD